jgi:hypothetical protein
MVQLGSHQTPVRIALLPVLANLYVNPAIVGMEAFVLFVQYKPKFIQQLQQELILLYRQELLQFRLKLGALAEEPEARIAQEQVVLAEVALIP